MKRHDFVCITEYTPSVLYREFASLEVTVSCLIMDDNPFLAEATTGLGILTKPCTLNVCRGPWDYFRDNYHFDVVQRGLPGGFSHLGYIHSIRRTDSHFFSLMDTLVTNLLQPHGACNYSIVWRQRMALQHGPPNKNHVLSMEWTMLYCHKAEGRL